MKDQELLILLGEVLLVGGGQEVTKGVLLPYEGTMCSGERLTEYLPDLYMIDCPQTRPGKESHTSGDPNVVLAMSKPDSLI